MTEDATTTKPTATKTDRPDGKQWEPRGGPQFIPALKGHKVLCRMTDGRPLKATLEAFNAYELVFDLGNGKKMLVFKHAVASIEYQARPGAGGA